MKSVKDPRKMCLAVAYWNYGSLQSTSIVMKVRQIIHDKATFSGKVTVKIHTLIFEIPLNKL